MKSNPSHDFGESCHKKKRIVSIITCFTFIVPITILTVLNMVNKARIFSENENRMLAQRPAFSLDALFHGSFTSDYEAYFTDQFAGRDSWISLKTIAEASLKKKELNGVYLAKDGYLIEAFRTTDVDYEQMTKNENRLIEFAEKYVGLLGDGSVKVILVPTASDILRAKLPDFAEAFDQQQVISRVRERLPDDVIVDISDVLKSHSDDSVFYRTDHHWTTKGAYYAYREWAKQCGFTPKGEEDYRIEEVTDEFRGTIYSKLNVDFVKPDSIFLYKANEDYQVEYNFDGIIKNDLYEMGHLETKDKYSVFLNGNNPLVKIDSGNTNGKKLLVVKDSYAHCFVPFVADHYQSVYMIDLRHVNLSLSGFIEEYGITDILVLYSVKGFISETTIYKMVR